MRTPSGIAYAAAARARGRRALVPVAPPAGWTPRTPSSCSARPCVAAHRPRPRDPTVVLVSDGQSNSAWYEHREIARRLELPLAAPADLSVRGGRLHAAIGGGRRARRRGLPAHRRGPRCATATGRPTWCRDLLLRACARARWRWSTRSARGSPTTSSCMPTSRRWSASTSARSRCCDRCRTYDLGDADARDRGARAAGRAGGQAPRRLRRRGRGDLPPRSSRGAARRPRGSCASAPSAFVAQEMVSLSTHPTVVRRPARAAPRGPAPVRDRRRRASRGAGGPDARGVGRGRDGGEQLSRRRRQGHVGAGDEAADRGHHLGGPLAGQVRADPAGRAPAPRDGARPDLPPGDRGGGRPPGGDAAAASSTPWSRCSTGSRASACRAAPTSIPAAYDERRHPELGPIEPELDVFELELARHADARGLPILAICRGLQALNVARGGTLHQHLPDGRHTLEHRQRPGTGSPTPSTIAPGSLAHRVMRRRRVRVNSFHHQAVCRLGQRAAGRSRGRPTG